MGVLTVFPTCVGMNRSMPIQVYCHHCVPHMRGDEPTYYAKFEMRGRVPHMRGDEPLAVGECLVADGCSPHAWG